MSDDIAQAVQDSGGQPSTVRIGTVVSTTPIQVDLGGTILGLEALGFLTPYTPSVGDVVALLGQSVEGSQATGSSWLALGAIVPSTSGLLGENGVNTPGPVGGLGTVSATFVNMNAAVTFQFTKRLTGTRVLATLLGSSFSTVGSTNSQYAARAVNNTTGVVYGDFALAQFFFNDASKHLGWGGFNYLAPAAMPAGIYTVTGRFRRISGTGTLSIDDNDNFSLGFRECY